MQQPCPHCGGTGKRIVNPCKTCHGAGRVEDEKILSVKIPAGVDNGDRIRLSGEGEAGPAGAPAGDLYVEIRVREHAIFQRDELQLAAAVRFKRFFDRRAGAPVGREGVIGIDGEDRLSQSGHGDQRQQRE